MLCTSSGTPHPYFKSWWKVLPWALAAAVCLSRMYLGAHFPLDVIAGAGLGMFIGGVLNLVFGVPGASPGTARASGLRSVRVHVSPRPRGCGFAVNMRGPPHFRNRVSLSSPGTAMAGSWLACTGSPVLLTVVLYTPVHSLIGQSLQLWMRSSELGEPHRSMVGLAAAVLDRNKPPRQRCTI